jgi:O-antigen/teichoic acid export membrane protein
MLVASLAVQSLLAWMLLPAGRGDYAVFAVVGTLVPALLVLGMDRSLLYHLMSGRIDTASAVGSLCLLIVASTVLTVGVVVVAHRLGYLPQLGSGPAAWAALILLAAGSLAHGISIRLHVALRSFRHYLLANLIQSALSVFLLVVFLKAVDGGYVLAIAALAASYALATALSARWILKGLSGRLRLLRGSMFPDVSGYAFRFYPTAVAHALDFNAGVLMLAAVTSSSEVGIFAALSAIMLRFLLLAQAVQEALLPRVAADTDGGRHVLVSQLARIAVWATAVMVLAFLPVSKWIVTVLLSPPFVEGISIVWWMAPGIVLHAASSVLMPYFEGRGRPGVVSIATWVGMTVNVASLMLLYPHWGLAGAGLAMAAAAGHYLCPGEQMPRSQCPCFAGLCSGLSIGSCRGA